MEEMKETMDYTKKEKSKKAKETSKKTKVKKQFYVIFTRKPF